MIGIMIIALIITKAIYAGRVDHTLAKQGIVSPRLAAKYGGEQAARNKVAKYGFFDFLADAWRSHWHQRGDAIAAAKDAKPSTPGAKITNKDRRNAARRVLDGTKKVAKKLIDPVGGDGPRTQPVPEPQAATVPCLDCNEPVLSDAPGMLCPACIARRQASVPDPEPVAKPTDAGPTGAGPAPQPTPPPGSTPTPPEATPSPKPPIFVPSSTPPPPQPAPQSQPRLDPTPQPQPASPIFGVPTPPIFVTPEPHPQPEGAQLSDPDVIDGECVETPAIEGSKDAPTSTEGVAGMGTATGEATGVMGAGDQARAIKADIGATTAQGRVDFEVLEKAVETLIASTGVMGLTDRALVVQALGRVQEALINAQATLAKVTEASDSAVGQVADDYDKFKPIVQQRAVTGEVAADSAYRGN